jgi:hypothetical protein
MSRARRPQRHRRHRGQRPECQRRTGEAGKFESAAAARRPALSPAGEIFPVDRLAAAPAGSRALRDMPGMGLRKRRQATGWRISEASEPGCTGGAGGYWPRLQRPSSAVTCPARPASRRAEGLRMSGSGLANERRACEALRAHRATRRNHVRWSGLTEPLRCGQCTGPAGVGFANCSTASVIRRQVAAPSRSPSVSRLLARASLSLGALSPKRLSISNAARQMSISGITGRKP